MTSRYQAEAGTKQFYRKLTGQSRSGRIVSVKYKILSKSIRPEFQTNKFTIHIGGDIARDINLPDSLPSNENLANIINTAIATAYTGIVPPAPQTNNISLVKSGGSYRWHNLTLGDVTINYLYPTMAQLISGTAAPLGVLMLAADKYSNWFVPDARFGASTIDIVFSGGGSSVPLKLPIDNDYKISAFLTYNQPIIRILTNVSKISFFTHYSTIDRYIEETTPDKTIVDIDQDDYDAKL